MMEDILLVVVRQHIARKSTVREVFLGQAPPQVKEHNFVTKNLYASGIFLEYKEVKNLNLLPSKQLIGAS